ncbi:hypothetical protein GCM10010885_03160 [Alicyclobacillus cellulosilyticus]|uniref:Uncharacterized protein n=1 Tax=Alicyclobacillus cellulosilyticus TaxID=1003997 RepID=A0A917K200_9BACL|nr:hypothetical protein [Alicyclobacillus cellulosilyticus]GGI96945.1 hypothetical protein GCM10010885_03160 [Alicyclobacillus cellulosilyticus]
MHRRGQYLLYLFAFASVIAGILSREPALAAASAAVALFAGGLADRWDNAPVRRFQHHNLQHHRRPVRVRREIQDEEA